jgi:GTP-binding protein
MFLSKTKFIISAPNKNSWPKDDLNEICFLGKSNVGKSSLLNTICNNSKIARVSSTPGCTKLLNFFEVDETYRIVDAPGYGYAKTSLLNDENFAKMMDEYIFERENVKLFVLLVDSRRELSQDDIDCLEMLKSTKKEVVVVGTKADKLNQSGKSKFTKNVKNNIEGKVYLTTTLKKESVFDLVDYIDKIGRRY